MAAVTVTVLYPRTDGARFDFDYYAASHMPLVARRWSPLSAEAIRGDAPDSPFIAMALIRFASHEALQAAMASPHSAEISADVANYTDIKPVMQVNSQFWSSEA